MTNQPDQIVAKFTWTDHNLQILREMADRKAGASLIARKLGTTRNAVIGKAFRQGIAVSVRKRGKAKIDATITERCYVPKKYKQIKNEDAINNLAFKDMPEGAKSLIDLCEGQCRFPVAKGLYCAKATINCGHYCQDHHILCHA